MIWKHLSNLFMTQNTTKNLQLTGLVYYILQFTAPFFLVALVVFSLERALWEKKHTNLHKNFLDYTIFKLLIKLLSCIKKPKTNTSIMTALLIAEYYCSTKLHGIDKFEWIYRKTSSKSLYKNKEIDVGRFHNSIHFPNHTSCQYNT